MKTIYLNESADDTQALSVSRVPKEGYREVVVIPSSAWEIIDEIIEYTLDDIQTAESRILKLRDRLKP